MAWDELAGTWDDDGAVRAYSRAAHASLVEVAVANGFVLGGARVCDFGCGTGLLTELLADGSERIDAVDTSPAMLDVVREKIARRGWSHVHVAREVPLSATYDLVVCSSVCAFVDDYPSTVLSLASHVRPGGLFVQWDWELDPSEDEPFGLSRGEMTEALLAAGLASVAVDTAFTVTIEDETMCPLVGSGIRGSS